MLTPTLTPIRLPTSPQARRASRLESVLAGRAPVIMLAGTGDCELARDLVAHLLRLSGRTVACGLPEAVAMAPLLTEGSRVVIAGRPDDAASVQPGPALLGLTGLRADELASGVDRTQLARGLADVVAATSRAIVVHADDPVALGLASLAKVAVHATGPVDPSPLATCRGGQLVLRDPNSGARVVLPLASAGPVGLARTGELLVSLSLALLAGAQLEAFEQGLATFPAPPAAFEELGRRRGVRWINDGRSTKPGPAAAAIRAAGPRCLVIAGGSYGGQPLDRWRAACAAARFVLVFGPAAEALAAAARETSTVVRCADLDDAVLAASKLARRGETVVFSPACQSDSEALPGPAGRLPYLLGLKPEARGEAA